MAERTSRRRYQRRGRLLGAQATRDAIVSAARDLFRLHGFQGTTIEGIAHRADVASQTVYATFGSKRAIALEMRALVERETSVVEGHGLVLGEADPRRRLRAVAALTRRICEEHGDLYRLFTSAHEPELSAVGRELLEAQRFGMRRLAGPIVEAGALRDGVDAVTAADVLTAMASVELYDKLVTEGGWSPDRFEAWLAEALVQVLLR